MWTYLIIGLGGALGSMARYAASVWISNRAGDTFPWGTFAVNVAGSFLIGLLASLSSPEGRTLIPPAWRHFFMIGVCGGFTTFSSFSLQTLNLVRDGDWLRAFLNVGLSVIACLTAVWLGFAAAQAWQSTGN